MNSLPKTVTRQRRDCDCPSAPEFSTLTTLLPSHPGWLSKFQSIVIAVVWCLAWMQLQDLRGNIRVFCRCRYDSRTQCCLRFPSDTEVLPPSTKKPFQFNRVFDIDSTQEQVRDEVHISLDGPGDQTLSDTRVGDKVRRVRASLRQVRGLCPVGSGRVWSGPCCGIWHLQGIRGWRTSPLFV